MIEARTNSLGLISRADNISQPDEARERRWRVRCRSLQGGDSHADHRSGNHRRQRELSERDDR